MTHQIVPVKTYVGIYAALIALTIATVLISRVQLGEFNFIVAMTIAVVKALLVVLFFMHVKQASALTKLFVAAGIFWLLILIVFLLSDYLSRGWTAPGRWWQ